MTHHIAKQGSLFCMYITMQFLAIIIIRNMPSAVNLLQSSSLVSNITITP